MKKIIMAIAIEVAGLAAAGCGSASNSPGALPGVSVAGQVVGLRLSLHEG